MTIKSDNNIDLTASHEVIMITDTNVTMDAVSKLYIKKESAQVWILLENDTSCYSDVIREGGSSTALYASSSQSPGMGGDR